MENINGLTIVIILILINMAFIMSCHTKISLIESHFFKVLEDFGMVHNTLNTTLEDIKHLLMKAYNINETPRPGKMQPKIKPMAHSDTELYDREQQERPS